MRQIILLILISFFISNLHAQFSREDAIELVVNEIVGPGNLEFNHTYSRYLKLSVQDTLWIDDYFDYFISPFDESWVFFIDLMPVSNWAHPCNYVFVNVINGEYIILDHNWPPHPYLSNYPDFLIDWEWILSINIKDNREVKKRLMLYPNPANDFIKIPTAFLPKGEIKITIADLHGKCIQQLCINPQEQDCISLNISGIPGGIYILMISQNGGLLFCEKVVKIK